MSVLRIWCRTCSSAGRGSCSSGDHDVRTIGVATAVDICVTDRRHALNAGDHGYYNMVGHSAGRGVRSHERYTRKRINEMRLQDVRNRRERRINPKLRDNPERTGAIPSALLFSYMRKYGDDYLQHVQEFMRREGLYWGEKR